MFKVGDRIRLIDIGITPPGFNPAPSRHKLGDVFTIRAIVDHSLYVDDSNWIPRKERFELVRAKNLPKEML